MNRYFRYLLLAIFIIAVLLIVFLQFNSNRSINKLIEGNENVLGDLAIKTNLQRLQTNIITLESKLRGAIISGSVVDSEHLYEEISSVNESLTKLEILGNDKSIRPLLKELNRQVDAKVTFNRAVLDTFRIRGKTPAEKMINTQLGKKLTDSIKTVCNRIDALHQLTVIALIHEADANGQRARILGSIIAVIAVIVSLFTFAYVTYELRRQQQLIARLNVSEKKAKEAAAIKENFLANMSHEIRTPLNAILGFTNLLQTKAMDGQTKEFAQTIQRSGENLMAIVNDVLDLSKIEAGMMRIEVAPFSIRALVHSVATMFRPKADEKQLQLCATVSEEVPDNLEGDPTRLTQILVNLIGNAIKFTSSGNIDIQITNKGITGNKINTGITVKDTGIGIAKEQLNKIFERFQQAEASVTRRYGGTGLGLSIVHELVQLQHGRIQVESTPRAGTTFEIVIPYTIVADVPVKNNITPQIPFEATPGGIKILVVEDNEINQNLVRHLFTNRNLSFDICVNGKEAIDRLQQYSYNIILMDIQMPEMDGYTAVQVIRQTLKLDTPVIAMTAHAMPGEREKCLSYGMNEYISKPIKEEQLFKLITRFTGSHDTIPSGEQSSTGQHHNTFRYIDLQYMKEISLGDREYEKTVTAQFLEMVEAHLKDIRQCWQKRDIATLRQTAHNMKTSVSIMGLTEQLLPWLDALEHESLTATSFQRYYSSVKEICRNASKEAREFLQYFNMIHKRTSMEQNNKTGTPDNTAIRTALWRALHVQVDAKPHILEDEIGLRLIAPPDGWQQRPDMKFTKRLRASIVARARFIEDLIIEQVRQGISQYVILGAGLDTFAQRRPDIASGIQVYEIDQPDTLEWKKQRLTALGFGIPGYLHFVPVNFNTSSWWEQLLQSGFDINKPSVIACTGVSLYLSGEANIAILHQAAALAPGSTLAMTFYLPMALLDEEDRPMQEIGEKGAREAGTPFVSFFSPDEIVALGTEAGFKAIKTISTKDMEQYYFANRTDDLLPASGEVFLLGRT